MTVQRRSREQIKLENRQLLLEAAKNCFLEKSYDEVSVRDIIADTGLASGTFYNYYNSKQAVFIAVLEGELRPLLQHMDELRDAVDSIEDYFYRTFTLLFSFAAENEVYRKMMLPQESVSRVVLDYCETTFEEDLIALKARGLHDYDDCHFLAVVSLGGVLAISRHLATDDDFDVETVASRGLQFIVGAMKGSCGSN